MRALAEASAAVHQVSEDEEGGEEEGIEEDLPEPDGAVDPDEVVLEDGEGVEGHALEQDPDLTPEDPRDLLDHSSFALTQLFLERSTAAARRGPALYAQ